MKCEKVFSLNSEQLSAYLLTIPELEHLSDQVLLKEVTGTDFYRMSPLCLLQVLELEGDTTVVQNMYALKQRVIDSLHSSRPSYDVFNGTVLELHDESVELCLPFHVPPVLVLRYSDLCVCPDQLSEHEFVQLLYVSSELCFLYDAAPIPLSYVSASVNFADEFQSLDFMNAEEIRAREILSNPVDALPFDAPSTDIEAADSYSHADYGFSQLPITSLPASSASAASIRVQPSFSTLALNTRPSMIMPEPHFFERRFLGRVDFLIEQVGIIVMPKFTSLDKYESPGIDYIREFRISDDLGLIVGFCAGWFTQRGAEQPQRGDIVEFTITPGYGFLCLDQCLNACDGPTYPYINNYEENKNSKIGQIQKRQQTFAAEISDFYSQNTFDYRDLITLSADYIEVIERFSKDQICGEKMVHGQTYSGVVYTYSEADNYGFIKSYGALDRARSYAQGFEVYFKIEPEKCSYIPNKGDFVSFKSHWVDEKAQARDIKYINSQNTQSVEGVCLGFYPPFALFRCCDGDEDLANNLVFAKYKQIPFSQRQGLKIGQKLHFTVDTDISTQFKAVFAQNEVKRGFSLQQKPSFEVIIEETKNPFSEGTELTRIQPVPLVPKCEIFELRCSGKMQVDVVVQVSPYLQCESGNSPPEYLFSNGCIISGAIVFYNQIIGIEMNEMGYLVVFEGLSAEHAIFREDESDIRLAISRNQTPIWVIGLEEAVTVVWTCRKEEEIAHGVFEAKDRRVDAVIISGTVSFKV